MKCASAALLCTLLWGAFAGPGGGDIYPADHFKRSHKLTTSNFDDIVKREVDSGKTLFVRWIASSG